MEAFSHCSQSREESWEAGPRGSTGPGDSAGSPSRPLAFCPDLGQPAHRWRGPDRKGQVSWKAPVGPDSLPSQGGPAPKNEHLFLGLLGTLMAEGGCRVRPGLALSASTYNTSK